MDELQSMADRLAELGYANDAARETQTLLLEIRAFRNRATPVLDRLEGVWKSVEWWTSADWSEESVREALAKYRGCESNE
jgi:hypothetical protein